jgi:RNA polymerase sigma factor (sigma-70 family)
LPQFIGSNCGKEIVGLNRLQTHTISVSSVLGTLLVSWMRFSALKLITFTAAEASDADLLCRFIARREEAAFEELVRRHGPAVQRVCRRLVGPAQADDAFQAVFLVLACRAKAVRKPASVGSWLIGVAGRAARQMRQQLRRSQVTSLGNREDFADPSQPPQDSHLVIPELAVALDEELTRLPDALRAPVVLCLVEGRTQEQAAAELGGSLRTLRRRLERAKELLRLRLERRGVVPVVIAALIGNMQTSSAVEPELVRQTVHCVFEFLVGGIGVRSAPAAIAKGVLTNMATFKTAALVPVAALVLIGLGVGWAQDKPVTSQVEPPRQKIDEGEQVKDPNVAADPFFTEKFIKLARASHRSTNFFVHAPTPTMARAIAAEAEYQRTELAKHWLGKELPPWEKPCEIQYVQRDGVLPGVCTFTYGKAKDGSPALATSLVELNGQFLDVLTNELPCQMVHVVMHSHFGDQLPRWADDGLAITVKPAAAQTQEDERCRQLLNAGRGIRLNKLLPMRSYPRDMIVLYAEGHSIARFLISQKVRLGPPVLKDLPHIGGLFQNVANGQQQFVVFLHLGMEKNTIESWNNAAKTVYGYESVDALEDAWLDFLRKPESAIKPAGERWDVVVTPKNPDLIPPTTLPGTGRPPAQR